MKGLPHVGAQLPVENGRFHYRERRRFHFPTRMEGGIIGTKGLYNSALPPLSYLRREQQPERTGSFLPLRERGRVCGTVLLMR